MKRKVIIYLFWSGTRSDGQFNTSGSLLNILCLPEWVRHCWKPIVMEKCAPNLVPSFTCLRKKKVKNEFISNGEWIERKSNLLTPLSLQGQGSVLNESLSGMLLTILFDPCLRGQNQHFFCVDIGYWKNDLINSKLPPSFYIFLKFSSHPPTSYTCFVSH